MLLNGVYQILQLHTQGRGEVEEILVVRDHLKREREDHHGGSVLGTADEFTIQEVIQIK